MDQSRIKQNTETRADTLKVGPHSISHKSQPVTKTTREVDQIMDYYTPQANGQQK